MACIVKYHSRDDPQDTSIRLKTPHIRLVHRNGQTLAEYPSSYVGARCCRYLDVCSDVVEVEVDEVAKSLVILPSAAAPPPLASLFHRQRQKSKNVNFMQIRRREERK
ncbi:hypothetical protein MGYG_05455 [Nannizzia gypsea CBS 118893]|uniref:Uncharacterized protein n=1 Tax=Arthroderma gypseum (strain ATCC MYA-4604 / CBS 118893) TaxID=535722 RepID=E4UW14_ARTGP|nr:hypothetical protein MGYG_05455 [Nannizzia gypsea CBS 118893]EFR02462.1 hypothetical protein MGYG_05455 [Nannizzia gypsea CBS 118893]